MLKKTVKYKDLNGEEIEEDFYFHLSKAELMELEVSHKDGMQATIERIVAAKDGAALLKEFKHIILLAYGKRSDDGRRFIKSQELRDEFASNTEAYSALFMELVTDTDAAIAFMNGIVPEGMSVEEAEAAGIDPQKTPFILLEDKDKEKPEPRIVTKAELTAMPKEEFEALGEELAKGTAKIAE